MTRDALIAAILDRVAARQAALVASPPDADASWQPMDVPTALHLWRARLAGLSAAALQAELADLTTLDDASTVH